MLNSHLLHAASVRLCQTAAVLALPIERRPPPSALTCGSPFVKEVMLQGDVLTVLYQANVYVRLRGSLATHAACWEQVR